MDEAAARLVVHHLIGEEPLALHRQPFGHHSVTFEVVLGRGSVMLHMHPEAHTFEGTAHNIGVLRSLDIPVPKLLHVDTTLATFPFAFTILERIEGRDLRYELPTMSDAQCTTLAHEIVEIQRRVARLPPGDGYGFVPIGATGPHSSWPALVEADHRPWPSVTTPGLAERLRELYVRYRPALAAVPPTCFLDDITTKNVIVHEGTLRGIVDVDVVCYGDPMYMLALTATAIVADLDASQLRYVAALRKAWRRSDADYRRACLYSAIFGMDFLGKFGADDAAWAARMELAMAGWIAEAEPGP